MAYGHSASGKSYTIDHLTLCCVKHIFEHKNKTAGGKDKKIFVSVFEIFQDTVHDLLSGSTEIRLQSAQERPGVTVTGLSEQVDQWAYMPALRDLPHIPHTPNKEQICTGNTYYSACTSPGVLAVPEYTLQHTLST